MCLVSLREREERGSEREKKKKKRESDWRKEISTNVFVKSKRNTATNRKRENDEQRKKMLNA